jgi:hypothetical protein
MEREAIRGSPMKYEVKDGDDAADHDTYRHFSIDNVTVECESSEDNGSGEFALESGSPCSTHPKPVLALKTHEEISVVGCKRC